MVALQEIGIRVLRQRLSEVMQSVRSGQSVVVTHNRVPIARIEPVYAEVPDGARRLLETGRATWSGGTLRPFDPVRLTGEGPSVSEMLLSQRGAQTPAAVPVRRIARQHRAAR